MPRQHTNDELLEGLLQSRARREPVDIANNLENYADRIRVRPSTDQEAYQYDKYETPEAYGIAVNEKHAHRYFRVIKHVIDI